MNVLSKQKTLYHSIFTIFLRVQKKKFKDIFWYCYNNNFILVQEKNEVFHGNLFSTKGKDSLELESS